MPRGSSGNLDSGVDGREPLKDNDHTPHLVGEGADRLTSPEEYKRRVDAIVERIPIEIRARPLADAAEDELSSFMVVVLEYNFVSQLRYSSEGLPDHAAAAIGLPCKLPAIAGATRPETCLLALIVARTGRLESRDDNHLSEFVDPSGSTQETHLIATTLGRGCWLTCWCRVRRCSRITVATHRLAPTIAVVWTLHRLPDRQ
jgi:hypothetical protein